MTYYSPQVGTLDQGDIVGPIGVREFLPWWPDEIRRPIVIVTPACDIAQGRAEYHRLCILQPLPYLLQFFGKDMGLELSHWNGSTEVSKGKSKDLRDRLTRTIRNSWPRFHFLPSETGFFETDYFVDFELLVTIPLERLDALPRHASMNAPYKQELIQRLSAHMMRIGTPDLTQEIIGTTIDRCVRTTKLRLAN